MNRLSMASNAAGLLASLFSTASSLPFSGADGAGSSYTQNEQQQQAFTIGYRPLTNITTGEEITANDNWQIRFNTDSDNIRVYQDTDLPCINIDHKSGVGDNPQTPEDFEFKVFTWKDQSNGSNILTSIFIFPDKSGKFTLPEVEILNSGGKAVQKFGSGELAFVTDDKTDCIHITPAYGFIPQGVVELDFDIAYVHSDGQARTTTAWVAQYDTYTMGMSAIEKQAFEEAKNNPNVNNPVWLLVSMRHISNTPPKGHGFPTGPITKNFGRLAPVIAEHKKQKASNPDYKPQAESLQP